MQFVSPYDAKTRLSALVDRAAAGEYIIIGKNGVPSARLVQVEQQGAQRRPAHAMLIEFFAGNFDAADARLEQMFGGDDM